MRPSEPADGEAESREQSNLAYDLRNPLTVIVGRVQLMRRRLRRGEQEATVFGDDLEAIEGALARLVAVIEQLDPRR